MTANKGTRTKGCSFAEARTRLAIAESYQEVAEAVLSEKGKPTDFNSDHVAGGLAVLAAIAASDAICCSALGYRARGQDHNEAVPILETALFGPGSNALRAKRARAASKDLATVLAYKDDAHYGMLPMNRSIALRLVRSARKLVAAATMALER